MEINGADRKSSVSKEEVFGEQTKKPQRTERKEQDFSPSSMVWSRLLTEVNEEQVAVQK